MKRYQFRLGTVQRLRAAHRDAQQARLLEALDAEAMLAQRRAELQADLTAAREAERRQIAQPALNVGLLLASQRYAALLRQQQQTLAEQAEVLAGEVAARRAALLDAEREVQVLERLDERQRAEHRRLEQVEETALFDELASMRHALNRRREAS